VCYLSREEIDYLGYVKMLNISPIFTNIIKNLDYEKIGLQILKDQKVLEEFTSHNQKGKIIKVEKGLKDPEFTIKIEEKTIKQMTSPKEQAWIEKHPIEAAIKYSKKVEMPLLIKLKLLKIFTQT